MTSQHETLDALSLVHRLKRRVDAHKGDAGKVLLVGGEKNMSGALVLAGQAALYSGAGWVVLMMLNASSAHLGNCRSNSFQIHAQKYQKLQCLDLS